jgi:hypothetical protein
MHQANPIQILPPLVGLAEEAAQVTAARSEVSR